MDQKDKPKYPDAVVVDKDNKEIGFSLGGNLFLNKKGENSLRKSSLDLPEGEKVSTKEGSMFTRFSLGSDLDNFIIDMSDKLGDKVDLDLESSALRYKIGDNSNIYIENIGSDAPSIGYKFSKRFYEGGLNMSEEDQMQDMLVSNPEEGVAETVDPVSGNDVPPGSLPEEVRDDVPAQLSEGEYVVPADVVRYFGVKAFEDMRMQAKQGMADMDAEGRIGGDPMQEEALPFSDEELITSDVPEDDTMPMMNEGGVVYAQKGIDLSRFVKDPAPGPNEVTYKTYVNAEGMEIIIPFLGNDPMGVIPEGYFLKGTVSDVDEESIRSGSGGGGGSDDDDNKPEAIDWSDPAVGTYEKFKETYDQMNSGTANTLIAGATALGGLPFTLGLKGMFKLQSNAMLKGVTSQLEGMQDSDPNYNQLLGMQNLLQGKNEDGSDKPKGGFMDTLFSGETYEGNSFTESFANMFTPGDGASYRAGQLVDDITGLPITPGVGNNIKGIMNSKSNDVVSPNAPKGVAKLKDSNNKTVNRVKYSTEEVKKRAQEDAKKGVSRRGRNKGGLVNRPKSKKNK